MADSGYKLQYVQATENVRKASGWVGGGQYAVTSSTHREESTLDRRGDRLPRCHSCKSKSLFYSAALHSWDSLLAGVRASKVQLTAATCVWFRGRPLITWRLLTGGVEGGGVWVSTMMYSLVSRKLSRTKIQTVPTNNYVRCFSPLIAPPPLLLILREIRNLTKIVCSLRTSL